MSDFTDFWHQHCQGGQSHPTPNLNHQAQATAAGLAAGFFYGNGTVAGTATEAITSIATAYPNIHSHHQQTALHQPSTNTAVSTIGAQSHRLPFPANTAAFPTHQPPHPQPPPPFGAAGMFHPGGPFGFGTTPNSAFTAGFSHPQATQPHPVGTFGNPIQTNPVSSLIPLSAAVATITAAVGSPFKSHQTHATQGPNLSITGQNRSNMATQLHQANSLSPLLRAEELLQLQNQSQPLGVNNTANLTNGIHRPSSAMAAAATQLFDLSNHNVVTTANASNSSNSTFVNVSINVSNNGIENMRNGTGHGQGSHQRRGHHHGHHNRDSLTSENKSTQHSTNKHHGPTSVRTASIPIETSLGLEGDLGKSNNASGSPNNNQQQSQQVTCQVCYLAASNGLHFGARTCAACAAFFRRSISDQKRYICKRSQRCVIRPGEAQGYRKMCRNCRMKRCIEIGMLPENVQNKRHRRDYYSFVEQNGGLGSAAESQQTVIPPTQQSLPPLRAPLMATLQQKMMNSPMAPLSNGNINSENSPSNKERHLSGQQQQHFLQSDGCPIKIDGLKMETQIQEHDSVGNKDTSFPNSVEMKKAIEANNNRLEPINHDSTPGLGLMLSPNQAQDQQLNQIQSLTVFAPDQMEENKTSAMINGHPWFFTQLPLSRNI
ncbi:zinc finger, c4 type (two domains) domain-containing protein [Ditylenchus destructor]|nr:zinc finger, c4 type (two domains) domain-containing protein [Ditylenchus destructor]